MAISDQHKALAVSYSLKACLETIALANSIKIAGMSVIVLGDIVGPVVVSPVLNMTVEADADKGHRHKTARH
jgi:hypothetical protein